MEITKEEQQELWRWAVHNRIFELTHTLSEITSTFKVLSDGKIGIFDSWTITERQLRICALELENLKKTISHLNYKPAP